MVIQQATIACLRHAVKSRIWNLRCASPVDRLQLKPGLWATYLKKENKTWSFSYDHLSTVQKVLWLWPQCSFLLLRHRTTGLLTQYLQGLGVLWSRTGVNLKKTFKSLLGRACSSDTVSTKLSILQCLLSHSVSYWVTIAVSARCRTVGEEGKVSVGQVVELGVKQKLDTDRHVRVTIHDHCNVTTNTSVKLYVIK